MDKAHYITRYGEVAYEEHRRKMRVNKQRKKLGLPSLKKAEPVNDITIKVSVYANLEEALADRLEEQDNIAAKLQKRLKDWWKQQTTKSFILVVDYGNLDKLKNTLSYKIELTQLNLQEDEISQFKVGAATITREILDTLKK